MHSSTRESDTRNLSSRARRVRRWRPQVLLPGLIVCLVAAIGVFAPNVTPYNPEAVDPAVRLAPPTDLHVLGADEFGRDILSRLAFGARITLIVSLTSVAIAATGGILIGINAGFFGGFSELIMMRIVDGLLAFPPILLALFIITFLGPSLINVILVIGLLYVPRFARVAYGATLPLRDAEYVQAARALGLKTARILGRHVLPNIGAPLLVQGSLAVGHAILLESGLSFLGLGPPPPAPSWGRMIEQSTRFMSLSPLPVLWPAIVVSATVLAFNLLGDAIRDILDPRLR